MRIGGRSWCAGDLVVVKSRDEILATLDSSGCVDGMPFMPEMLKFCGQRLRIAKVAHKTCDTKCKTGGRSVADCVHLEGTRCDGAAHGGCQAQCNLFWKTIWLRQPHATTNETAGSRPPACDGAALMRATRHDGGDETRYRCQATQIVEATAVLPWWDIRQYVRDVTSGNASAAKVAKVLILSWFAAWHRFGYPYRLSRWCYDHAHRLLMRRESPRRPDDIDYPQISPTGQLGIQPGERVRIKSHREIRQTLNPAGYNRGLWFDVEMVPFCGGEYQVTRRVEKIINEQTGQMIYMKNPCLILEGVVCCGDYSDRRLLCPRAIPSYWREIWLERIRDGEDSASGPFTR